ncbi:hypothetical protein CCUS01_13910 [Colletotrichum cuscutae]|uniref:Uncharacterized protein n=1 Tax=Colletotrichum cuscutae TaxID=1209917 RepID=A0AAI9YAA1_9PEZI|nr:hypothetical protein CCUS01_13910 [Colletotrichum cuscutae]
MSQCQDISAPVTEAEPPKPSSAFRHRMLERPSARWAPQITQKLSTCPSCTLQAFSLRIRGDMDPRQTRAGIVGSRPMTGCHRTWITVVVIAIGGPPAWSSFIGGAQKGDDVRWMRQKLQKGTSAACPFVNGPVAMQSSHTSHLNSFLLAFSRIANHPSFPIHLKPRPWHVLQSSALALP